MCVSGMGVCAMRVSTGVMTELLGRREPVTRDWGWGRPRHNSKETFDINL